MSVVLPDALHVEVEREAATSLAPAFGDGARGARSCDPRSVSETSIVHAETAFACGRCGEIVLLVWRGAPTPACVERAVEAVARAAEEAGGRIGMFSVIEAGSPPPSITQFPRIARAFDAQVGLVATAGVFEDRGPLAVVVVEAMSTVLTLAQRQHPLKICADAKEAATWMAARLGASPDALRRDAAVLLSRVRAAIDEAEHGTGGQDDAEHGTGEQDDAEHGTDRAPRRPARAP